MSDVVVSHIVGLDVQVGSVLRQRCGWCGAMLHEMDLSRIAWALNEDGTDPGPPGMWEVGAVVAVDGNARWTVPKDQWPDSAENPGEKRLPDGCCALLDPAATA